MGNPLPRPDVAARMPRAQLVLGQRQPGVTLRRAREHETVPPRRRPPRVLQGRLAPPVAGGGAADVSMGRMRVQVAPGRLRHVPGVRTQLASCARRCGDTGRDFSPTLDAARPPDPPVVHPCLCCCSRCRPLPRQPNRNSRASKPRRSSRERCPATAFRRALCSTRADIRKATGRDPFVDPEPAGQGGWICNVGTGELKLYSGPKSWEAWESTLKGFKKDKEPWTPAPSGERADSLFPSQYNKHQPDAAFLVATSGNHTLALSLDAPEGQSAESMRPALESLMKTILARLPR